MAAVKKSEADPENPRGIPSADYIVRLVPPALRECRAATLTAASARALQEDVGAFLGDEGRANEVLKDWQERYQKYKLMEAHLNRRRDEIKKKIPDITGTRELLAHIIKKRVRQPPRALRSVLCALPPQGERLVTRAVAG